MKNSKKETSPKNSMTPSELTKEDFAAFKAFFEDELSEEVVKNFRDLEKAKPTPPKKPPRNS